MTLSWFAKSYFWRRLQINGVLTSDCLLINVSNLNCCISVSSAAAAVPSPCQQHTLRVWAHKGLLCDFFTSGNPEYQLKSSSSSSSPGKVPDHLLPPLQPLSLHKCELKINEQNSFNLNDTGWFSTRVPFVVLKCTLWNIWYSYITAQCSDNHLICYRTSMFTSTFVFHLQFFFQALFFLETQSEEIKWYKFKIYHALSLFF